MNKVLIIACVLFTAFSTKAQQKVIQLYNGAAPGYAGGAWWSFRNGQVLLPAELPLVLATWVLLLRRVALRIETIIAV